MQKRPNLKIEAGLYELGFSFVGGIDEAGRGALAGPLVAACVILPRDKIIYRINDSKALASHERRVIAEKIKSAAISWAIGISSVAEINLYGIQSSSYLAFERAVKALRKKPDFILIDHYRYPKCDIPQRSITKGDQISLSIAAASIIAKTERDNILIALNKKLDFKKYGFAANFGYGTKKHFHAIRRFGKTKYHRNKFLGIDKRAQTVFNFDKGNKKGE